MYVHNRSVSRLSTLLLSAIGLLTIASASNATTRTVPSQYSRIQDAIDASVSGDVIDVLPGTYTTNGFYNLDFGNKDLTLESTGGPGVTILDNTGGTQADQKQTVTLNGGQTAATVIKGFTIKNSFSDTGGAITIVDSTATITQCVFLKNTAVSEGGAVAIVSNGAPSGAIISQCSFLGNGAGNLTDTSGFGGAIGCVINSGNAAQTVTVTNCIFDLNTASYDGGAIDAAGPNSTNPQVSLINCSFVKNNANGYVAPDYVGLIPAPSAGHQPGAVDLFGGQGTLTNCVLYGDTAPTEISTLNPGWTASFSDINQTGYSGVNSNISLPPKYIDTGHSDPTADSLHLQQSSPVISLGQAVGTVIANGGTVPNVDLGSYPRHTNPDMGAFEIHSPNAISQSVTTLANTAKSIVLTGTDSNAPARTLTYAVGSPAHGTLTGTAPNLTYTPATNFSGVDSFTFTVNNGNYTSASATVTISVTLTAPSNLVATPISSSQINLTWNSVAGATSYNIYRSLASGAAHNLVGTSATASFSDTGLSASTSYYYVVVAAVNGVNNGPKSNEVGTTTFAPTPGPLSNLSATGTSTTQISLTWYPATNATGYKVFRSNSAGTFHTYIGQTESTSYVDSGLSPGTSYYYVVVPTSSNGAVSGPKSTEVAAVTLPSAPTNVQATSISNTQINLTWNAVSGATSYHIFRGTVQGGLHSYVATTTSASYNDTQRTSATAYYYIVTAVDASGEGPKSVEVTATTRPGAPTGVQASAVSSSQINLTWNATPGATSYHVFRGTVQGGSHTYIATTTNPSFSNTGLAASTAYYYIVIAVNAPGEGPKSPEFSATTLTP